LFWLKQEVGQVVLVETGGRASCSG